MDWRPTRSVPPPGWTLEETVLKPYAAFLTFALVGAVGLVIAGMSAEDRRPLPPLASHGFASLNKPDRDRDFAETAAESCAGQLALARLARRKAAGGTVKKTAARVQGDQLKTSQTLKVLAWQKGWQLPATPTRSAEATRSRLETLKGARFDRGYIDTVVRDHLADISAFESEAAQGTDPALKRFAVAALPDLRTRLHIALQSQRSLQQAMK